LYFVGKKVYFVDIFVKKRREKEKLERRDDRRRDNGLVLCDFSIYFWLGWIIILLCCLFLAKNTRRDGGWVVAFWLDLTGFQNLSGLG